MKIRCFRQEEACLNFNQAEKKIKAILAMYFWLLSFSNLPPIPSSLILLLYAFLHPTQKLPLSNIDGLLHLFLFYLKTQHSLWCLLMETLFFQTRSIMEWGVRACDCFNSSLIAIENIFTYKSSYLQSVATSIASCPCAWSTCWILVQINWNHWLQTWNRCPYHSSLITFHHLNV